MTQPPVQGGKPLTGEMHSSVSSQQQSPLEATSTEGSFQTLPSLRDTVGKEYNAKREIAPGRPGIRELFIPGVHEFVLDGQPIRIYKIGQHSYMMQQPPHETRSEFSRITVENRKITYVLEIVQQPEKARACGSGNKSSNDRRPVDPPPVVELKVFSETGEITMTYDATFMIYASLELARPILHGKLHTPPTIPVLAGVTVASAAYLEKPRRAAYFIFPDLSVRHEGWYRLRFSLFEGVKHDGDADLGKPFDRTIRPADNLSAPVRHEGVFNRMDVLSTPFQVYSAKKFPGLNQSTALSVLVAEQGCRVRIRRDARQRKRLQKADAVDETPRSYQGTPRATYPTADHSRSDSRNSPSSQYERRESLDSQYGRPNLPSRQMSTSSLPMTSPLLPTPTSSMPPPSAYCQQPMQRYPPIDTNSRLPPPPPPPPPPTTGFRSGQPSIPLPSPATIQRVSLPDADIKPYGAILAPMQTSSSTGEIRRGVNEPRYQLPPSAPTKRSYSPNFFSPQMALKSGHRPDTMLAYSTAPPLPSGNEQIEADDDADDYAEDYDIHAMTTGPLEYTRADGATVVRRIPRYY